MKSFRTLLVLPLLSALVLPGCTRPEDTRNDPDAKVRVQEDGGIDIQAPGVDVRIDPSGVDVDVKENGPDSP